VYLDKLRDGNTYYPGTMGQRILRQYRQPKPAEDVLKAGKGVFFQEFIQYIIDGARNEHWKGPYSAQCQPCAVDYDAIVKLETFSTDLPPILQRLAGRSPNMHVNSFSKASWNEQFVKNLKQYGNISTHQIQKISDKYQLDLAQFGYEFERKEDRSLDISCRMKSESGDTCC
jgi:hypothetical protein